MQPGQAPSSTGRTPSLKNAHFLNRTISISQEALTYETISETISSRRSFKVNEAVIYCPGSPRFCGNRDAEQVKVGQATTVRLKDFEVFVIRA